MSLVWLTTTPAVTAASKAAWTFMLSSSGGRWSRVVGELVSTKPAEGFHTSYKHWTRSPDSGDGGFCSDRGLPMLASGEAPYPSCPSSVRRMTRWQISLPTHPTSWYLAASRKISGTCAAGPTSRSLLLRAGEAGLVPFQGGYLNGPKASKCHCPDFRADWGGNLNAERDWDHAG